MAHILLVDDDQDLIDMNKTVLTQRGHEVTVAYSAAEARQAARDHPPDAAVLDVMMEDKTAGFDLARELHKRQPDMPMLMLTGIRREMGFSFRFEPDETWLPVARFMEKPQNPRVIADELDKLLAAKGA